MEIINNLKSLISKYLDILIFVFFVFVIEVVLRINVGFDILSKKAIFLFIISIFPLSSLLSIFKYKKRKIIESFIVVILSFYAFSQNYHFLFFEVLFSFSKLSIVSELGKIIKEVIAKFDICLLIYPAITVFWLVLILRIKVKNEENKKIIWKIITSLFAILMYIGSYQYLFKMPDNDDQAVIITSEPYLYKTMSNKNRFFNRFGMLPYLVRDIEIQIDNNNFSLNENDKNTIQDYINSKKIINNEYTGILENKNVIFILAESLCPQAIDEELAPTLYKLKSEGLYFSNFYSPIYPSATNDQEFITQTSMMPSIEGGTTSYTYQYNYYPYSLANLLKNKNYQVNSYHSFIRDFYNREPFHEALGFSHFYDRDDLNIYIDDDFVDYYNWTDDNILFEKMVEYTNTSSVFYDFVISASGHLPYMDLRSELFENKNIAKDVLGVDDDIAYYFASQMKLDQGLEKLINILEERDLLDKTAIIIVGDHYPYGAQEKTNEYLYGNLNYDYEMYKTPFIIYNSSIEGREIANLCSTFDVLPTLANMLSLDLTGGYYLGCDATSNDNTVYFADGSLLDRNYYYDATTSSLEKYCENDELIKNSILEANKSFTYSQLILKSDFYNLK